MRRLVLLQVTDLLNPTIQFTVIKEEGRCYLYRNNSIIGASNYCEDLIDTALKHAYHVYQCMWYRWYDKAEPEFCSKAWELYNRQKVMLVR